LVAIFQLNLQDKPQRQNKKKMACGGLMDVCSDSHK